MSTQFDNRERIPRFYYLFLLPKGASKQSRLWSLSVAPIVTVWKRPNSFISDHDLIEQMIVKIYKGIIYITHFLLSII